MSAVGLVTLPILSALVGPASFGLISVYTSLQAWFQLVDMGMSPTLGREVTRWKANAISKEFLLGFVKLVFSISLIVSSFLTICFVGLSGYISEKWLINDELTNNYVQLNLMLMAPIFVFRFLANILKSIVVGCEEFLWFSKFNFIIATLRFVVALPVIFFVDWKLELFFLYQIFVSIIEFATLSFKSINLLGFEMEYFWEKIDLQKYSTNIKFSGSVAATSIIWALMTQSDKVFLSRMISLSDFGYYALAATLANGVVLLLMPITSVLSPALIKLKEVGDDFKLRDSYNYISSIATYLLSPLIVAMIFFPKDVIFAWSGNLSLVENTSGVLILFSVGNAFLVASTFQYFLQVAYGSLRLHVRFNTISVLVYLPFLYFCTFEWKEIGAAASWMLLNALTFLFWVPYVHIKFLKSGYFRWFRSCAVYPYLLPLVVVAVVKIFAIDNETRPITIIKLSFAMLLMYGLNAVIVYKLKNSRIESNA